MSNVAFPDLGLSFNIDPVAFTLFGKEIYWYGIIISFAFLLAILLAQRDARKYDINPEHIIDLALFAIPAAIIGARLYYVVFQWQDFIYHPRDIIRIWKGGLAIYGAILAAIVVAYLFARWKKIGALKLFDFCAPYLVLGQAIGRWGNFINQEAYGSQTALPWRMEITAPDSVTRISVHPTFLYESLWNMGIFIFLILFRKKSKVQGEVFFLYMILYGLGRFWIEGLRTDSLMLGGLRISQVLAAVFVVALTVVLVIRRKRVLCRAEADNKDNSTLTETEG